MTVMAPQLAKRFTPEDLLQMTDAGTLELVAGEIVDKTSSIETSKIQGLFYFRI